MGWFLYEIYIFLKRWCCYKYNHEKGQKDEEKFIELDSKFSASEFSIPSSDEKNNQVKRCHSPSEEPISSRSYRETQI